jgi:hypothetical protein
MYGLRMKGGETSGLELKKLSGMPELPLHPGSIPTNYISHSGILSLSQCKRFSKYLWSIRQSTSLLTSQLVSLANSRRSTSVDQTQKYMSKTNQSKMRVSFSNTTSEIAGFTYILDLNGQYNYHDIFSNYIICENTWNCIFASLILFEIYTSIIQQIV